VLVALASRDRLMIMIIIILLIILIILILILMIIIYPYCEALGRFSFINESTRSEGAVLPVSRYLSGTCCIYDV